MTELRFSGVLWDMDGTIVDTELYWMKAEEDLVHEFGGNWTKQDAIDIVGADLWFAARVFQSRGVALSEDEIVTRMTDSVLAQIKVAVPWRQGARELLLALKEAGIPCALVTMSLGRMAQQVVDAIGFEAFTAVVGGDDVIKGKPHPEPYLRAAELLGVDATACIAIEDSPTGVAAAVASGAVTIGVPAHVAIPESNDYALWPTLEDKTVADLDAHFTAAKAVVA